MTTNKKISNISYFPYSTVEDSVIAQQYQTEELLLAEKERIRTEVRDQVLNHSSEVQWSLCFKTTHGTKRMWYYIAGGLKIKVI